jgi:GTP cyclohydrolase II
MGVSLMISGYAVSLEPAIYLRMNGVPWVACAYPNYQPAEGHINKDHVVFAYSPDLVKNSLSEGSRFCSLTPADWFSGCTGPVPLRIHSECLFGDVFGFDSCDCGEQLDSSIKYIVQAGCGLIVYLRQEGRGIGISAKIRAMLQNDQLDTFERNLILGYPEDARKYQGVVDILNQVQVSAVELLSESPSKSKDLVAGGIKVERCLSLPRRLTAESARELLAKNRRGYQTLYSDLDLMGILNETEQADL